jgi:ketopantoate reductase
MVDALGTGRVLIGFPAAAGFFDNRVIQYLAGTEDEPKLIPFGEVDGGITERTKEVARILDPAEGFGAEIRADMDAWLKSHVAFLVPGLAGALYAADTDNHRLARTRDALVLATRAIRESLKVLKALNVEIVPAKYKMFLWLPEPVLVKLLRRFVSDEVMETAIVGHANAARNEIQFLVDEFLTLARTTSGLTPAIDRLYPYFDPETPLIPDGSEEIPLRCF